MKKNYGNEILNKAYAKYFNKQKITYEEYVIMLATNDELWFVYNNAEYQIIHETNESTVMHITKFRGNQKICSQSDKFTTIIELLDKFRIEDKKISEIWDDVSL